MPSGKLKLFGPLGGGMGLEEEVKVLNFPIFVLQSENSLWMVNVREGGSPIKDFFLNNLKDP